MYWSSNVPPYTQYSLIQSQIWFRGGRTRFSGFTICPFPYNVVVCNPLFIPIRFKKGSILFRASRDVHITTRSSKFFWLNSCGTHFEYFHIQSYFPNMVRNGLLSWIKLFCDLRCRQKRILLQHRCRSKMVAQNVAYQKGRNHLFQIFHLLHVLSKTVPSPNTFNKFLHASVAFLVEIRIKYSGVNELYQSPWVYYRFTFKTNVNQLYYSLFATLVCIY